MITEHLPAITAALERHYEAIRRELERLAGVPVRSHHYYDIRGFAGHGCGDPQRIVCAVVAA